MPAPSQLLVLRQVVRTVTPGHGTPSGVDAYGYFDGFGGGTPYGSMDNAVISPTYSPPFGGTTTIFEIDSIAGFSDLDINCPINCGMNLINGVLIQNAGGFVQKLIGSANLVTANRVVWGFLVGGSPVWGAGDVGNPRKVIIF